MKKITSILSFLFIFNSSYLVAQSTNSDTLKKEREIVLNLIINSKFFDSVYSIKKMIFLENELLSKSTLLQLERKGYKVVILDRKFKKKLKSYFILEDFVLTLGDYKTSRVQLELFPKKIILNFYLTKDRDNWEIRNHLIIKDE